MWTSRLCFLTHLCPQRPGEESSDVLLLILVTVIQSLTPNQRKKPWGSKDLYENQGDLVWMDQEATQALVQKILIPSLEESVLHADFISEVLKNALEEPNRIALSLMHLGSQS